VWRWITRLFRLKKAVKHVQGIASQEQNEIKEIQDLFAMLEI
jgi:hypothetical protein